MITNLQKYPVIQDTNAHLILDSGHCEKKIMVAAAGVFLSALCIFPYLYGSSTVGIVFVSVGCVGCSLSFLAVIYFSAKYATFRQKVVTLLANKQNWWAKNFNALESKENAVNSENRLPTFVVFVKEGKQKTLIFCPTPKLSAKHLNHYLDKGFSWENTEEL